MRNRVHKIHPALKHGAYSATGLLPGESRAAFEKLHRDLIGDLSPNGVIEEDTVASIAGLVWRKQNLATIRREEGLEERDEAARWLEEMEPAEREERLLENLAIEERIDSIIDKHLKRLLFLKGLKSLPTDFSSAAPQRIPGPKNAA